MENKKYLKPPSSGTISLIFWTNPAVRLFSSPWGLGVLGFARWPQHLSCLSKMSHVWYPMIYAKSLWILKHAKTGRDRPVIKPYPDAPWCWNSYLHLPQKLPKGKYSIHGAYGILDPWYSSIPISVPTPSALSSLTSFDCWGHTGWAPQGGPHGWLWWGKHFKFHYHTPSKTVISNGTIWLFNIAMENPNHKCRFLAGKIIYKWAIYTMAMLNNQRVAKTVKQQI